MAAAASSGMPYATASLCPKLASVSTIGMSKPVMMLAVAVMNSPMLFSVEGPTVAPAPYALNAPNRGKLANVVVPAVPCDSDAESSAPTPNPVIVTITGTLNLMCIA